MNKTPIECEQCFKVYKTIDSDDVTCEKDLRVGMCRECMRYNVILMDQNARDGGTHSIFCYKDISHNHQEAARISLISKIYEHPINTHIKEYISICDQVPLPSDI